MTTHNIDENAVYHADTRRIGKSGLDLIAKSPAHYYAKYLDPNRVWEAQTPTFLIGSAVHAAILEPDEFKKRYAVEPTINKRTNDGKTAYAELMAYAAANRINYLDAETYASCEKMRDAVHAHPAASVLLSDGQAETRLDWQREIITEDGEIREVLLKAKPDWLSHNDFIVDVKTTEDASPQGFGKSVWNYRYHVQDAFYMDAYEHFYGGPARGFIFIAVEKKPPYAVALYFLPNEVRERGRNTYERNLRTYLKCLETGEWPAYGTEVMELQLPNWAK
jgi:exodeoxyribonuclease VIII